MPFFGIPEEPPYDKYTHDVQAAKETVKKVQCMDGYDNLFVVMAHDATILDHVEFFPKLLNDWSQRGLAEKCRWGFLHDFHAVLGDQ